MSHFVFFFSLQELVEMTQDADLHKSTMWKHFLLNQEKLRTLNLNYFHLNQIVISHYVHYL